ncbi:hypothetical protein PRIPAC_70835 [Pristionchus pacificus]|nr:hypothetical protein PRIPAC_70835 [Pristionchus pacificus]
MYIYIYIYIFDPMTNKWHTGLIESRKLYGRSAVIGEKIYFIGNPYGYRTGGEWYNDNRVISVFDPLNANEGWVRLADMERGRSSAACCVANGKLYMPGGFDGNEELKDGERYDPATNK